MAQRDPPPVPVPPLPLPLPPPLLAAPLLCSPPAPVAASLLLPRHNGALADLPIVSLSLCCLVAPAPQCHRPEQPWIVAAQSAGANGCGCSWMLLYSVTERQFIWRICRPSPPPSAATVSSASSVTSVAGSTQVELCSSPVLHPFAHIALCFDTATDVASLFINGALEQQLKLPLLQPIFGSTVLQVGGCTTVPIAVAAPFLGLISDVHLLRHADVSALESTIHTLAELASGDSGIGRALPVGTESSYWHPPSTHAEPLHSLRQLLSWRPGLDRLNRPRLLQAAPRCPLAPLTPQLLHCHDMAYREDADAQHGLDRFDAYAFRQWKRVDTLLYFSHARLALPPRMWTEAAHRNGVQVLACFCTEWAEGTRENIRLLEGMDLDLGLLSPSSSSSSSSAAAAAVTPVADLLGPGETSRPAWQRYADRMVALALEFGIDGWFLNIEAPLPADESGATPAVATDSSATDSSAHTCTASPPPACASVVRMCAFLSYLTRAMHLARPGSRVLWYDSIRAHDGAVCWQSKLNQHNSCFLDACDGIFTDYHWKAEDPGASAQFAQRGGRDRRADVYTGIDVFGRGTFGGGGLDSPAALEVIAKAGTSAALFAPAWTYEGEGRRQGGLLGYHAFLQCEHRLWLELPLGGVVSSLDALDGWEVVENGGDGWAVLPRGEEGGGGLCLATSHKACSRRRLLDLRAAGCSDEHIATGPDIRLATEYAATPPNLDDRYQLHVQLLDADMRVLDELRVDTLVGRAGWQAVHHTFRHYARSGPGTSPVRWVRWTDGGVDAEHWAGHFGTRIGDSRLWIDGAQERHHAAVDAGADAVADADASASTGLLSSSSHASPCIAQYVPPRRMALTSLLPFVHAFNTGNGLSFSIDGAPVSRHAARAPHSSADAQDGPRLADACPWFNLSLQDVQTILADPLLGSGVAVSARSGQVLLSVRAQVSHDVGAFDGGACLLLEAQVRRHRDTSSPCADNSSAVPASSPIASPAVHVRFDCFEFGPSPRESAPPSQQDLAVSYIFSRDAGAPCFGLGLLFELSDESGAVESVLLDEESASSSVRLLDNGWTEVCASIPAHIMSGRFVSAVRVQLGYNPSRHGRNNSAEAERDISSASSRQEMASLRLGQVRMRMTSRADALLHRPRTCAVAPASMRCTPHFSMDALSSAEPCDSFTIEWGTNADPAAALALAATETATAPVALLDERLRGDTSLIDASSFDVFLDGRWLARVLSPQYFLQLSRFITVFDSTSAVTVAEPVAPVAAALSDSCTCTGTASAVHCLELPLASATTPRRFRVQANLA